MFLKTTLTERFKQKSSRSQLFAKDLQEAEHRKIGETDGGEIKLYNSDNIESCVWPQNSEGEYAQRFLTPLIQRGVTNYIENVRTDLRALVWDELVLPITVNDGEYENSYVCSPYGYYISYAKESLSFLTKAWTRYGIKALLWSSAKVLRHYQVNKVVMVNNWLYSTNLYPQLESKQLIRIVDFLQQQFPDYAIVFRSIDPYTSSTCYQALQQIGFDYIASRQIFFIRPHETSLFESRLFKSDLKLLKNSGYEIIAGDQLTEQDFPRALELYRDLYIEKYSELNPKFNEDFVRLLLMQKLMHFKVLKKEGRIDGIVGYVQRNGMMLCPFFGYDRAVPKETALYRLLSTVLMLEAYEQGLLFHQSSGASTFKKIRKAQDCIEYMAVYSRHLSFKRKIPWRLLKNMCNSMGINFMKRY